jgi:ribosomal protein S18 acetylase RimI-like enzyme
MTITAVEPPELAAALALLSGSDGDAGHAFRLAARGELNASDVLVARRDGAIIGAVFASRVPGGVAIVWPPRAVDGAPAVEDELANAALKHVAGAKVVQSFLPPEESGRATPLLRVGFRHVTRVWQMTARRVRVERFTAASGLTEVGYLNYDPSTFHATLVRAHDDSLDCPELHGLLSQDEMLAGYRDSAPDGSGWWLAVADNRPAGVLLLNGNEVTFLGVVPEWRGRGVGRRLLGLALERADGLTLIVDARNTPAIRLYQSAGLEFVGAREVFLYFPGPAAGTTDPSACRS